MYRSIEITNYRCFDHLKVNDLARVNIICGANNSGKTALLEAIYLHAMQGDRLAVLDVVRRFGGEPPPEAQRFWEVLFFELGTDRDVTIAADCPADAALSSVFSLHEVSEREELGASLAEWTRQLAGDELRRLESIDVHAALRVEYRTPRDSLRGYLTPADAGKYRLPQTDGRSVPFVASRSPSMAADAVRFREVAVAKETPEVVRALNTIEPRLRDLRTVPGTSTIYGESWLPRLVALTDMGEGLQRLLSVTLALWTAKGGVVLIDEVENGLHHSVLGNVWRLIGEAARRFDVQVFATTHSWECITAAHQAFREGSPDDLRVHRIEHLSGKVWDVIYSDEELEAAIESRIEVR